MNRLNRQVKLSIAAVVLLVLPWIVFIGTTSTVRINGVVTQRHETNFFALFSAITCICIAWAMAFQWETQADRHPRWKVVAGLIAVAAVAAGYFGLM